MIVEKIEGKLDQRIWAEHLGTHVAHTIVGQNGVYYDVCEIIGGERGEHTVVWSAIVPYGKDKPHRCGGLAFTNTAREQAALLNRLHLGMN